MEIMINKKSKLIVSVIFLIVTITISIKSFAANIYTSKLSKGDILQFTGNAWHVYSTKDNAKSLKKDSNNKTLKKDDKFTILEIDGNVLKIKDKAYIYYGSTAKDYFKKIEKNSAKNESDNSTNAQEITVNPTPSPDPIITEETTDDRIVTVTELIVQNMPTKTEYLVGEDFDKKGMKIVAKYSDKSKKEITNYKILDGEKLKVDQKSITISYTEENIKVETKLRIKVTKLANQEKTEKQKKIVALARKQVGKKYVYGAAGPNQFDCSGLTLFVYKKILGISLPHSANAQAKYGKAVKFSTSNGKINCSNMQLGDLIVFSGHVGIYSGNGKMIDAAGKKKGVVERSFNNSYWITTQPLKAVRRFV